MKLLILGAALAAQNGVMFPPSAPQARDMPTPFTLRPAPEASGDPLTMPNALGSRPGCLPLVVQVARDKRDRPGSRLDQQPPAQLLLAVDRHVDGCREATIIRNVGPRSPLLDVPPR